MGFACAVVIGLAGGAVGCGGGGRDAKTANVKAGNMPDGEEWRGVYFHPVFGYLHMIEQDTNIVGRWKRTDQSAWGEMSGTKMGNVVHFTWKEHKYGLVGPSSEIKGKGVFVYKMGDNKIGELDGQFGVDDSEVGSDWHCVKQQRMNPDLNSISGDMGGTAPPPASKWE